MTVDYEAAACRNKQEEGKEEFEESKPKQRVTMTACRFKPCRTKNDHAKQPDSIYLILAHSPATGVSLEWSIAAGYQRQTVYLAVRGFAG
jgi:hypothetical protein